MLKLYSSCRTRPQQLTTRQSSSGTVSLSGRHSFGDTLKWHYCCKCVLLLERAQILTWLTGNLWITTIMCRWCKLILLCSSSSFLIAMVWPWCRQAQKTRGDWEEFTHLSGAMYHYNEKMVSSVIWEFTSYMLNIWDLEDVHWNQLADLFEWRTPETWSLDQCFKSQC